MSNDTPLPRVEVDTAKLPLMLGELRLPAIARMWAEMADRSDREGWPAARFLSALAEIEIAERARRRIERHMAEARLPPDKTLDGFDFAHLPMLSRAQVSALASGDAWLSRHGTRASLGSARSAVTRRCRRSRVRPASSLPRWVRGEVRWFGWRSLSALAAAAWSDQPRRVDARHAARCAILVPANRNLGGPRFFANPHFL